MLFERKLCQVIGLLDEAFGTGNFEDDDFCLRATIAGYRNLIAGDVFVHHYGGVSFSGADIDYRKNLVMNSALFREKWSRPVTDRTLAESIAFCRAKEEMERLLLDEREAEADEVVRRFCREFPNNGTLPVLCTAMKSAVMYDISHSDPGSGLPYLKRAEHARQRGEDEHADALVIKGFVLEPWRPDLLKAVQRLAENGVQGLLTIVDEAVSLFPGSRGLARLRILLSVDNPDYSLSAAERFLRDFGPDDEIIETGIRLRHTRGYFGRDALPGKSIALCMIARNEEQCLARCLASCKPVIHEMIVVDTGSDDRTQLIAELFGAHVVTLPWEDDFSAARNASLAAAQSDWLLIIDADEVLSARDLTVFAQVMSTIDTPAAFKMTTRNYSNNACLDGFIQCKGEYPEDEPSAGWTPSTKIRLFSNHRGVRFEGVVHELVESSVQRAGIHVLSHPVVVHHYGGLEEVRQLRKRSFYYALGQKKVRSGDGHDSKALYELAIQAGELKLFDEAEKLWRMFLQNEKGYAPAWSNFGYVLLRRGLTEAAWSALEQALQIQPEYLAARINRALCAFCMLSVEQAEHIITSELPGSPDDITLRILRELCRAERGNDEYATSELRNIVAEGFEISRFILETTEVLEQTGLEGRAEYMKILLKRITEK